MVYARQQKQRAKAEGTELLGGKELFSASSITEIHRKANPKSVLKNSFTVCVVSSVLGYDHYTRGVRASVQVCGERGAGHTSRDNDDDQQDDDGHDHAYAHLDILPPHLLPHAVGSPAEALGRDGQVVSLILEGVQTLSTLRDLVDVLTHHTDGVIDLLHMI